MSRLFMSPGIKRVKSDIRKNPAKKSTEKRYKTKERNGRTLQKDERKVSGGVVRERGGVI